MPLAFIRVLIQTAGTMVYTISFKSYNHLDACTIIIPNWQMRKMRFRKDKSLTKGLAEQYSNLGCHIIEYKLLTFIMYCLPFRIIKKRQSIKLVTENIYIWSLKIYYSTSTQKKMCLLHDSYTSLPGSPPHYSAWHSETSTSCLLSFPLPLHICHCGCYAQLFSSPLAPKWFYSNQDSPFWMV